MEKKYVYSKKYPNVRYTVLYNYQPPRLTKERAEEISRSCFEDHPEADEIRRVFRALAKM